MEDNLGLRFGGWCYLLPGVIYYQVLSTTRCCLLPGFIHACNTASGGASPWWATVFPQLQDCSPGVCAPLGQLPQLAETKVQPCKEDPRGKGRNRFGSWTLLLSATISGKQWPRPLAILLLHHHGGLPLLSYLNPGTEEPLFTTQTCFVGVSVLWTSSPQPLHPLHPPPGGPGTLLNSLLACTTPSPQECFSYLFSSQGSWQLYSESIRLCNLQQGRWQEGLGSLL